MKRSGPVQVVVDSVARLQVCAQPSFSASETPPLGIGRSLFPFFCAAVYTGIMAPKVMRDMPEERHQSSLAVKVEIPFPSLIAELKGQKITEEQTAVLDKYLAKYEKGLPGQAAFQLTKMCVGLKACKDALSILSPGFMNDHNPSTHEHPPIV